MYSILKSQKRALLHKKGIVVTSSLFLTNSHIFLAFSDSSCAIYFLNLSETHTDKKIWQSNTSSMVIESARLKYGSCALICNNLTNIYVLEFRQNYSEHTFEAKMKPVEKSQFANIISHEQNGLMNTLGGQIKLHGLSSGSFIVQYFIYKDRKVILDCYKYHQGNGQLGEDHWELSLIEIDLEINGHFVVECINQSTGQLSVYKQTQIQDTNWVVRVFSPFAVPAAEQNPHNPSSSDKETRINLPEDKFNEDTAIMQICQYIDNTYMIITSSKTTGKLSAQRLSGLFQDTIGSIPQNNFIFETIPDDNCSFLKENFSRILYVNTKDELFYALTHEHQIVNGEIYFNALIIGNLRSGKLVEKGYCSLRNISFSPDFRSILDMPSEFDKICTHQTLFHVRLLLSKSSLYMFLIEGNETFHSYSDRFKNTIIQLL